MDIILYILEKRSEEMIKRTHDEFYAREEWKKHTKESFKYIGGKVLQTLKERGGGTNSSIKILDIGCSNGDFLFYLSNLFPNSDLSGVDVMSSLLDKMCLDFRNYQKPEPKNYLGNIESGEGLPKDKYDLVFMNGVIGIFDDLKNPLNNFVQLIDDGGIGYIWSGFNPYPIDVLIKGRRVDGKERCHWESGWNTWSKQTLLEELSKLGYEGRFYDDFSIGIDILPQEDFLRSWTVKMADEKRMIINGLGLIHHFSLLEVTKK